MEENKEFEEQESANALSGCGKMPSGMGSDNPGDWDCQDGRWVWVENIGG